MKQPIYSGSSIAAIAFYLKSQHEEKGTGKTYSKYKQYKANTGRFFTKRSDSSS